MVINFNQFYQNHCKTFRALVQNHCKTFRAYRALVNEGKVSIGSKHKRSKALKSNTKREVVILLVGLESLRLLLTCLSWFVFAWQHNFNWRTVVFTSLQRHHHPCLPTAAFHYRHDHNDPSVSIRPGLPCDTRMHMAPAAHSFPSATTTSALVTHSSITAATSRGTAPPIMLMLITL